MVAMTESLCCVVCTTNPQRVGVVCHGCYHRTDDALYEIAERWGLMASALLDPASQPEQRVSGTREQPLPGGEALNLIGPANAHHVHRDANGRRTWQPDPDQVGDIDPTETLWSWVRDWLTYRTAGETGPTPDLAAIVGWLRARLDWAANNHPAVNDFAGEVRHIADTLRRALSIKRHVQRYIEPCPRCDTVALYREVDPDRGASAWVQCGSCGNLWRESEFARLSVILDDEARRTT